MNSNTLLQENDAISIENIFESNFIPIHYYPYSIQLYNLFLFKYLNKQISPSLLVLFSISKNCYKSSLIYNKRKIEYTAIYNIYYQYYSFDDKQFVTYDELLNYILTFN